MSTKLGRTIVSQNQNWFGVEARLFELGGALSINARNRKTLRRVSIREARRKAYGSSPNSEHTSIP